VINQYKTCFVFVTYCCKQHQNVYSHW